MRGPVHLLNPLRDMHSGSDLRTLRMFELLSESGCDVRLWSPESPHADVCARYPARALRVPRLAWPSGGTLIVVGVYFRLGSWLRLARFERVIVLYNTDQPDRLEKALTRLKWTGCARIEVVHTSAALRELSGVAGPVLESPVDLTPFLQIERALRGPSTPLVVGRVSRDCPKKHHAEDIEVYKALAARGVTVRILGGTCLAGMLAGVPGIELLEAGSVPVERFLAGLDVFYYRTDEHWFEAFGRVIFEAMAAGLALVACARGGYAPYLQHGVDASLFASTAEALAQLERMIAEPGLRERLGREARRSARRICGQDLTRKTLEVLGLGAEPHTPRGAHRTSPLATAVLHVHAAQR